MKKHFRHQDTKTQRRILTKRFRVSLCVLVAGKMFPDKSGFPFHSNRLVGVRDMIKKAPGEGQAPEATKGGVLRS